MADGVQVWAQREVGAGGGARGGTGTRDSNLPARPGLRRREGPKQADAGFGAAISRLGLEWEGKQGVTRGESEEAEQGSGCGRGVARGVAGRSAAILWVGARGGDEPERAGSRRQRERRGRGISRRGLGLDLGARSRDLGTRSRERGAGNQGGRPRL